MPSFGKKDENKADMGCFELHTNPPHPFRSGLWKTQSETGGGPTLSQPSTPTCHRTSLSRRSTESSSWFSCRRSRTLPCRATTSSSPRPSLSSSITRWATAPSSHPCLRRSDVLALSTCKKPSLFTAFLFFSFSKAAICWLKSLVSV